MCFHSHTVSFLSVFIAHLPHPSVSDPRYLHSSTSTSSLPIDTCTPLAVSPSLSLVFSSLFMTGYVFWQTSLPTVNVKCSPSVLLAKQLYTVTVFNYMLFFPFKGCSSFLRFIRCNQYCCIHLWQILSYSCLYVLKL